MKIKKELSSTLMVSNLFVMILVIAIHYNSKNMVDISSGITWNYAVQEFITNGIARIAVPFFALVSGFFIYKNVLGWTTYLKMLKKKGRTLLLPYLLGSSLLLTAFTFYAMILSPDKLFELGAYEIVKSVTFHPISVQYWFLRDIIVVTILSPLIFNVKKWINYLLGISLTSLWLFDVQPFPIVAGWYLINIEVLFFFWMGGNLYSNKNILYSILDSTYFVKVCLLVLWISLVLIRMVIDPYLDVWYVRNYNIEGILLYKLAILVGIISLIQISEKYKSSQVLLYLSGLTFFVYLFHLLPVYYLIHIISINLVDKEFSFYLDFPLATVSVFLVAHFISSRLSPVYVLLTGGRSPDKVIQRLEGG